MKNAYLLALHSIGGLGPVRLKALLDYFVDPKLIWEASVKELSEIRVPKPILENFVSTRKKLAPVAYADAITKSGIKWLTILDQDYPKLLAEIPTPPVVLYYRGQINWHQPAVAVVGSRKMTSYGRQVTNLFTKELAKGGLVIISGLARGVDTEAHQTALEENGQTIAVLGGGLNKIFPPENEDLAQKIINGHGLVISEFPPDAPSMPGNFPARNRIIAGLSLATIVTEAAEDSGSLITARLAVNQGREVYAVPGPITSALSHGSISLIKQGAKAVFNPNEILEDLGITKVPRNKRQDTSKMDLTLEEIEILNILENESMHIDDLGRELNWPAAKTASTLIKMEISGLIKNLGNGIYCRR